MVVHEEYLERLIQCPIMVPKPPESTERAVHEVAQWALRQSFEGKLLGDPAKLLHDIRGKILEAFSSNGRVARIAGFRLLNVLLDYEVLHLEQPYNLILGEYTIQGQYALLRKRKGECLPHVLVLHSHVPDQRYQHALPPDLPTLARAVHVCTNTKYSDARLLHYAILQAKHWTMRVENIPLAKKYLEGILKMAAIRPQFPVIGEHCSQCSTKPCLEVFRGQNDDSGPGRKS